jgi:hypothetical protein
MRAKKVNENETIPYEKFKGWDKGTIDGVIDYVYDFYGKDSDLYGDFFNNELTREDIIKHLPGFFKSYSKFNKEFDSFDTPQREMFRDYLMYFVMNKPLEELEFDWLISKLINKK